MENNQTANYTIPMTALDPELIQFILDINPGFIDLEITLELFGNTWVPQSHTLHDYKDNPRGLQLTSGCLFGYLSDRFLSSHYNDWLNYLEHQDDDN